MTWLMQTDPVTYAIMERLVQACIHQLDVFQQLMVEPTMQAIQEVLASIPAEIMLRQLQQSGGADTRVSLQSGAASHTPDARRTAAPGLTRSEFIDATMAPPGYIDTLATTPPSDLSDPSDIETDRLYGGDVRWRIRVTWPTRTS